jgi:hypothetical protein
MRQCGSHFQQSSHFTARLINKSVEDSNPCSASVCRSKTSAQTKPICLPLLKAIGVGLRLSQAICSLIHNVSLTYLHVTGRIAGLVVKSSLGDDTPHGCDNKSASAFPCSFPNALFTAVSFLSFGSSCVAVGYRIMNWRVFEGNSCSLMEVLSWYLPG